MAKLHPAYYDGHHVWWIFKRKNGFFAAIFEVFLEISP
jgi:hypothetical protein